jgi:hypothetical protein
VNGINLEEKDEVAGVEVLPGEGEIFVVASDGKAKRIDEKDFPTQGRYGKGVIVWDLPEKVKIAGTATGKPNHMATIHLTKGAAKSTRLDAAGIRKRAATKGDLIVEVKPGEEITSVVVGWAVEKFVESAKEEKPAKKKVSPNGKTAAAANKGKHALSKAEGKKETKKTAPKKTKSAKKSTAKKASKPAKKKSK